MNINLEDQSISTSMIEKGDILFNKETKDAFLVVRCGERYNLIDLRSNTMQSDNGFMERSTMLQSVLGITSSNNLKQYELIKSDSLLLQRK